jgi:hypothetical protein
MYLVVLEEENPALFLVCRQKPLVIKKKKHPSPWRIFAVGQQVKKKVT